MKYLGIDYGTKRIGVAVSDENGTLAFPKDVLESSPSAVFDVANLYAALGCGAVVIGESADNTGGKNKVNANIHEFGDALKNKISGAVYYIDESFTSADAHGRQGKSSLLSRVTKFHIPKKLDASAAALILQRYLDKEGKKQT